MLAPLLKSAVENELKKPDMMIIIAKAALVVLAGVYAMRATSVLFNPEPFEPLMLVAAFAFVMSIVLFYRPPTSAGIWLYTAMALCLVGVVANTMLFLEPNDAHRDVTNLTFSLVSIVGWAAVGLSYGMLLFT
jgi:hypothetical protein